MKRTLTIDVEPTPTELANSLARMDCDQQAEFFNMLAKADKSWKGSWPIQLQYVTDSAVLDADGRRIMKMIGGYGPERIG